MNTKMEIPKEINISEIQRWSMNQIDGSGYIRYSALVNGLRVMSHTDGFLHPHISIEAWAQKVVLLYIERYNELNEANK